MPQNCLEQVLGETGLNEKNNGSGNERLDQLY